MLDVTNVAVVGAGAIGSGIAEVVATKGFYVKLMAFKPSCTKGNFNSRRS
jgi:3-hydroxyacyl-CoA dehydrogenase